MKATRVFTREDLDAWARLTGDANAGVVSDALPFVEYELQRQRKGRVKTKGSAAP